MKRTTDYIDVVRVKRIAFSDGTVQTTAGGTGGGGTGPSGPSGVPGISIQGNSGPSGFPGSSGVMGPSGAQGVAGLSIPGGAGGSGPVGNTGPSGGPGASGASSSVAGNFGAVGSSGASGNPAGPVANAMTIEPTDGVVLGGFRISLSVPQTVVYNPGFGVFYNDVPGQHFTFPSVNPPAAAPPGYNYYPPTEGCSVPLPVSTTVSDVFLETTGSIFPGAVAVAVADITNFSFKMLDNILLTEIGVNNTSGTTGNVALNCRARLTPAATQNNVTHFTIGVPTTVASTTNGDFKPTEKNASGTFQLYSSGSDAVEGVVVCDDYGLFKFKFNAPGVTNGFSFASATDYTLIFNVVYTTNVFSFDRRQAPASPIADIISVSNSVSFTSTYQKSSNLGGNTSDIIIFTCNQGKSNMVFGQFNFAYTSTSSVPKFFPNDDTVAFNFNGINQLMNGFAPNVWTTRNPDIIGNLGNTGPTGLVSYFGHKSPMVGHKFVIPNNPREESWQYLMQRITGVASLSAKWGSSGSIRALGPFISHIQGNQFHPGKPTSIKFVGGLVYALTWLGPGSGYGIKATATTVTDWNSHLFTIGNTVNFALAFSFSHVYGNALP